MDFSSLIYALPLWLLFFVTVGTCAISVELGCYLAKYVVRRHGPESDAPLGSLVSSLLGLLAFILAFTFGMTASRYESRKQLLLEEANALGTVYLRAGLLPAPHKSEVRRLLFEYTQSRLKIRRDTLQAMLEHSDRLQDQLWHQAELLVQSDMDSELRSLFISALNDVIDLHESRLNVGLRYRIPAAIWLSLCLLTILSMLAIGYQMGMAGPHRLYGMPLVTLAFSVVIVMIADIDRPGEGAFQVSDQPLQDTYQMMQRYAP